MKPNKIKVEANRELLSKCNRVSKTDLGYGEPLMGFWPYFLQDQVSEDKPSAGTSQTLFSWFFL